MRVVFAGTPAFAAQALAAILDAGFQVPLVLTQPDRPAGRGMQSQASPVKQLALTRGLPIHQPEKLRDEASRAPIVAAGADVMVVAAYGLILPQAVLDIPRLGCINIHASLLPRWRGAAPIQRAIEAGDAETGVTIMRMDAGLDTGPMLLREVCPIAATDNATAVHDCLAALGARLVVAALSQLENLIPQAQPVDGVTYAHKIAKDEAPLDWRQTAPALDCKLRAFDPFPGGLAHLDGVAIKVWRGRACPGTGDEPGKVLAVSGEGIDVACGDGVLRLLELQKPGGKRLPVGDFLRGFPVKVGQRFALAG